MFCGCRWIYLPDIIGLGMLFNFSKLFLPLAFLWNLTDSANTPALCHLHESTIIINRFLLSGLSAICMREFQKPDCKCEGWNGPSGNNKTTRKSSVYWKKPLIIFSFELQWINSLVAQLPPKLSSARKRRRAAWLLHKSIRDAVLRQAVGPLLNQTSQTVTIPRTLSSCRSILIRENKFRAANTGEKRWSGGRQPQHGACCSF